MTGARSHTPPASWAAFSPTRPMTGACGPLTVTGTMKNWDVTSELHRIKTRALTMGARYDEMDPNEMRRIATLMPNARPAISSRGSHLCMYDDQQRYFRELIGFLKQGA